MKKLIFCSALAVLTASAPVIAEENTCVASEHCSWALLDTNLTQHDFEAINAELTELVAMVRTEIVEETRDDALIVEHLQHAKSLCAMAKCKAQKSTCAEAHQLAGLHGYLMMEYVPDLLDLDSLEFPAPVMNLASLQ